MIPEYIYVGNSISETKFKLEQLKTQICKSGIFDLEKYFRYHIYVMK